MPKTVSKKTAFRLLLTEDDRPVKLLLERELPHNGPVVAAVCTGKKAEDLLADEEFDVSQVDFEIPGVGRVETRRRRSGGDDMDFVVIEREVPSTMPEEDADTDDRLAERVLAALGEEEGETTERFLTKPMQRSELRDFLKSQGIETIQPKGRPARRDAQVSTAKGPMLGDSPAMREVMTVARRIAAGSASVLIHGETGTGKTMVARLVHERSPRAEKRFVAINCSAFQDQLLESELFGHEKGSFTGAVQTKTGLFETANGGTLFLDEIGDMSSAMQAKLLQVLDDGEFRRVGGTQSHKADVRVIAATNKDLQQEVKKGRFREDLLFRLNVIHLEMPPLRARREDIPRLIEFFLDRFRIPGQPRKQFSPEAMLVLMAYDWPGNVRELANSVEGLILLAPGDEIRAEDLPAALRPKSEFERSDSEAPLPMKEIERLHIQRTLRHTEGKKAPAARLLGIDIKTLNAKIERYDIEV